MLILKLIFFKKNIFIYFYIKITLKNNCYYNKIPSNSYLFYYTIYKTKNLNEFANFQMFHLNSQTLCIFVLPREYA